MNSIEKLSTEMDLLQRRLHKLKKANMQAEDFLHSGEMTMVKFIAHHQKVTNHCPTLVAFANHVGISQATATTLADRLIAKGLMTKEPSPTDKRAKLLSLTDKGMSYLMVNQQRHLVFIQSIHQALGDEDTASLTSIVEKINRHLAKREESTQ